MKHIKYSSIIIHIIPIVIFIIFPTFAFSESIETVISTDDKSGPMVISSNMFEIDNEEYIVTFLGDVDARRDNLIINCQKIQLYYRNTSSEEDSEKIQANVDKIIATGEVKIRRLDGGGKAMAEKAVYYHNDEKVVLTGDPVVRQGDDFVEGSTVTLFLKENRSVVEGSEDSRAKVVFFPKRAKR